MRETVRLVTSERRAGGGDYDECWCVFDTDDHSGIPDALQLASGKGIKVARSNPCIELWFALHFHYQAAHIDRVAAQRLSEDHLGCGKNLTAEALDHLVANFDTAASRARALDDRHEGNGSAPGSNPSSGMWRLIESIRGEPDLV